MSVICKSYMLVKQEYPSTDRPWWIACLTINKETEGVRHRIIAGPYISDNYARVRLREIEEEQ